MSDKNQKYPKSESNDDDCENYFLQPASSPYDINEKIEEANLLLFAQDISEPRRQPQVQFKDALLDYEPHEKGKQDPDQDLTDDDVESIQSFCNEMEPISEEIESEELKYIITNEVDMPTISDKVTSHWSGMGDDNNEVIKEDFVEVELEESEEIIEDIATVDSPVSNRETVDSVRSILSPKVAHLKLNIDELEEERGVRGSSERTPGGKKKQYNKLLNVKDIDCKKHCIEALESQWELRLQIQRLSIGEKACPTLRLQKRQCCKEKRCHSAPLPQYDGLRSEYGLTSEQLRVRSESARQAQWRRSERTRLAAEYTACRQARNEQIFQTWLDNARAHWKRQQVDHQVRRKYFIPKRYILQANDARAQSAPTSAAHCVEHAHSARMTSSRYNNDGFIRGCHSAPCSTRQSDSDRLCPVHSRRKSRSWLLQHVSSKVNSCRPVGETKVFVEVPREMLMENDLSMGDLIVKSFGSNVSRKLHIVSD